MTTKTITDSASIQRQGLLLEAMEASAAFWDEKADLEHLHGHAAHALQARQAAWRALRVANGTRRRLVTASQPESTPGLADVLARLPDDKLATAAPPRPGAADHEVIDRPELGYRIHLPYRPVQPSRWRRWVARLLVWVLAWPGWKR